LTGWIIILKGEEREEKRREEKRGVIYDAVPIVEDTYPPPPEAKSRGPGKLFFYLFTYKGAIDDTPDIFFFLH